MVNKIAFYFGATLVVGLFLGTSLLNSCKKKNLDYEIQGVIGDASFQNNLSGATVELLAYPSGSTVPTVLNSITTGSDGAYSFSFKRDKYSKVEIAVSKANYFSQNIIRTLDELDINKTNTFNFSMFARSWVRIHIVGNGTRDVKYIRQEGKNGCSECCPEGERFFYNVVDTSIYCINNGNTIYQIYYNILTTPAQGPLQVNTVAFDTTELLISY